ncbi:hypothetical protein RZO50_06535 [Microbacterium sp. SSW1-59]|uniref:hypothetical protein n=1 Tax=Microbacterium xanthum TaxID=3079794 RepID=UPI002AD3B0FA|nr:hypothetical protein [Microbacterium sp. SSW1-59]MDZ8201163.1 hypothetical protein [Microbacterium sp. SSW1-59]
MNTTVVLNLGISQAAVATLATTLMIGLGFLRRPSAATALWSMAFVLVMITSYASISAEAADEEIARVAAIGFMLGAPAFIWSGLRAARGASTFAWIAPLQSLVSAGLLVVLSGTALYSTGFALLYLGASLVAGLTAWELFRRDDHGGGMLLPLTLVSGVFTLLGILVAIVTIAMDPAGGNDLLLVRTVNSVAMVVYMVCAVVSLLFLSEMRDDGIGRREGDLRRVMQDRLSRAEDRDDSAWSLLTVTLDDVTEIRAAAGDGAFTSTMERMIADARATFPAESDIGPGGTPGSLLVLVPRSENEVREHMRAFLQRLSTMRPGQPLAVQLSASIGWAPAREVGFDLAELITAALAAEADAREAGGDGWYRVGNTRRPFGTAPQIERGPASSGSTPFAP